MTLWFVLFSIIFYPHSNLSFRNFLSIPSDTEIKLSFGTNSREENKFFNFDYIAGSNTWIIKVKYVIDFNQYSFWRPLNYQFSVPHKSNKKRSRNLILHAFLKHTWTLVSLLMMTNWTYYILGYIMVIVDRPANSELGGVCMY